METTGNDYIFKVELGEYIIVENKIQFKLLASGSFARILTSCNGIDWVEADPLNVPSKYICPIDKWINESDMAT